MKKVIYTKYSTERSDKFKIVTSIIKDEDENLYVKKKSVHEKAQSHIEGLLKKYKDLKEYYNESTIEFVPCEIVENNAVFPFVEGESLESRLDKYIEDKDCKGILHEIENYKKMITDNLEIVPFKICDDFIGVFGANYPEEGVDAFKISDIDLIFSNIIVSDDKWKVIDYEWTFDFPVPVDFIIYRAVKYYAEISTKRIFLTDNNVYAFLGISERERKLYDKMDDAFQAYVYNEYTSTWELYRSIKTKNVSLEDIIDKNINFDIKDEIQIFYDYGEGFSEETSYKVYKDYDNSKELEIEIEQGIRMLRVDPAADFCVVKVIDALGSLGGFYELEVSSNGVAMGEGCFAFPTQDPQIYLHGIKENTDRVIVKFEIQMMSKSVVYNICKAAAGLYETIKRQQDEINNLSMDNQGKQNIINDLNIDNQEKQNIINDLSMDNQRKQETISATMTERNIILASTSWKITKPYRAIAELLKKCARVVMPRRVRKALFILLHYGFRECFRNTKAFLDRKDLQSDYVQKVIHTEESELKKQRKTKFDKEILFSIIVPLYNTPIDYLTEMIQSCQNQTYGNWELCLADGSDKEHQDVGETVMKLARKDKRIRYRVLEKNGGISENTNAALDMAKGNYIALLDHDDLLHPSVLYEYMQAICRKDADFIYCDEMTFEGQLDHVVTMHFKPDFALDNLRANNYICHFSVFRKELLSRVGKFRSDYDGSQDHDMILRLTEQAETIVHIPQILYYWRSHPQSVASDINSKTYAIEAGKRAVKSHIERFGMRAEVESSRAFPTIFKLSYELQEKPLISIIIPNKDNVSMLMKCIASILDKSTYSDFEILVVENNSQEEKTFACYEKLQTNSHIRVIRYEKEGFNYSAINNYAVNCAKGSQLLFLNNDIEILTPNWMEEMLMYSQREDVAAVGAKLYYENNTIQHAGIILGMGADRCAGVAHHQATRENLGYMGRLCYAQNFSAVTAACLMVAKDIFEEAGGFDERLAVAYNDVDLCLQFRKKGYVNIWTPYAEAYHYESVSRGYDTEDRNKTRFAEEVKLFKEKWWEYLESGDPYYNPNMTLDASDFSLKMREN